MGVDSDSLLGCPSVRSLASHTDLGEFLKDASLLAIHLAPENPAISLRARPREAEDGALLAGVQR